MRVKESLPHICLHTTSRSIPSPHCPRFAPCLPRAELISSGRLCSGAQACGVPEEEEDPGPVHPCSLGEGRDWVLGDRCQRDRDVAHTQTDRYALALNVACPNPRPSCCSCSPNQSKVSSAGVCQKVQSSVTFDLSHLQVWICLFYRLQTFL